MSEEIVKLSQTQQEILGTLKKSYERYNRLVERVVEVVSQDYTSSYAVKKAILTTLSESLSKKDDF